MDAEQIQMKDNVSYLLSKNTILKSSPRREEREVSANTAPSKPSQCAIGWRPMRIVVGIGLLCILLIIAALVSVVTALFINSAQRDGDSRLLLKPCKSNCSIDKDNNGSNIAEGTTPSNPAEGMTPSNPAEGFTPSNPAEGMTPSNPAEGMTPSNPAEGMTSSSPAVSCRHVPNSFPSGYYWLLASNGSSLKRYCDMTRTCKGVSGGWMRVASLDMRLSSSECPSGLCDTNSPRTCRRCRSTGDVLSETYSVGVPYSRVCGRVIAYQIGTPNGYADDQSGGIHLTYGDQEEYIWAFIAALQDVPDQFDITVCPCMNPVSFRSPYPLKNFGDFYFCDAAPVKLARPGVFYRRDPLWDGSGCRLTNLCCSFNNPPWFLRELSRTTSADIKMTLRLDNNRDTEDIAIEIIDIYVQ